MKFSLSFSLGTNMTYLAIRLMKASRSSVSRWGLPGGSVVNNLHPSAEGARDAGLVPV